MAKKLVLPAGTTINVIITGPSETSVGYHVVKEGNNSMADKYRIDKRNLKHCPSIVDGISIGKKYVIIDGFFRSLDDFHAFPIGTVVTALETVTKDNLVPAALLDVEGVIQRSHGQNSVRQTVKFRHLRGMPVKKRRKTPEQKLGMIL